MDRSLLTFTLSPRYTKFTLHYITKVKEGEIPFDHYLITKVYEIHITLHYEGQGRTDPFRPLPYHQGIQSSRVCCCIFASNIFYHFNLQPMPVNVFGCCTV